MTDPNEPTTDEPKKAEPKKAAPLAARKGGSAIVYLFRSGGDVTRHQASIVAVGKETSTLLVEWQPSAVHMDLKQGTGPKDAPCFVPQ